MAGLEERALGWPDETGVAANIVGPVATDVPPVGVYDSLPESLRMIDETLGNGLLARYFARIDEHFARFAQKAWKIPRLTDVANVPPEIVDALRYLVGLGDDAIPASVYEQIAGDDRATARKLVKGACRFWARRGRRDALYDLCRLIVNDRPAIDSWFDVRFLVGEVFVGVTALPGADPWALIADVGLATPGITSGEVAVSIRLPIASGDLTEALAAIVVLTLARPVAERYEVALVDFLDTFAIERGSNWQTKSGPQTTWIAGDSSIPQLPGLLFTENGQREGAAPPLASTWAQYHVSAVIDWLASQEAVLRFYVLDDSNYYFARFAPPGTVEIGKVILGVSTVLATTAVVDLSTPAPRGIRVNVEEDNVGVNQIDVWVDGDLVLSHHGDSDRRSGAIEFEATSAPVGGAGFILQRVELFTHPLTVLHLTP